MVTVVTMFPGVAVVLKTPSPSTRPSREPIRIFSSPRSNPKIAPWTYGENVTAFLRIGPQNVLENSMRPVPGFA